MKKSEVQVKSELLLESGKNGVFLYTNNVGALPDKNGRLVRFGLANDSHRVNSSLKSSDLIGWTPTVITQDMIGRTIGVFTSIETKCEGWRFSGTDKEVAQKKWIDLVKRHGGIAFFFNGEIL